MNFKLIFDRSKILFLAVLSIFLFFNYNLISQFKSLPSPLYGGDLYYHLGMMYHFLDGGSIFENSQLLNETPWAPFLYQIIIVFISKIFNTSLIIANIYSSLLFMILSSIIVYFLSKEIFKEKIIAIIPVCFILSQFPVFKYSYFTEVLIMPLFFYTFFLALKKNDLKHWILAGLTYGLVGISHVIAFFMATFFILVLFFFIFFLGFFEDHSEKSEKDFWLKISKKHLSINFSTLKNIISKNKFFFLAIIIGLLISQLYWFKPIFKHHLSTPNRISEYDQPDLKSIDLIEYTINSFKEIFLDFSSFQTSIFTIFSLLGISYLLLKKRSFEENYVLIILISLIFSRFHYLITIPLFSIDLFSRLLVSYIWVTLKPILFTFSLVFILDKIFNNKKYFSIILLILCLILSIFIFDYRIKNDRWIEVGKMSLPNYLIEVSSWIRNNTNVNDVFLSTNEISFMLNAISGRKVVNSRRAHSGMYVDVDTRWADAAVLLYGNNSEKIKEIVKKYNIKYLYWQANWVSLDFRFDGEGNLVDIFDPLLIRDIKNYANYLSENGVKFLRTKYWLDPANRADNVKKFDVLLVIPYNMSDYDPFSPELKKYLKLVKEFKENNEVVAKIYEIVI
ncbi:MAG: glycosyltransferase family 39 protein [Candidatus Aenigmatarchaeota archaeon]